MQKAIIDLSKNGVIPVFHAKQGDTSRRVSITLLDNGLPYDTAADAVSVWYSGPSGEGNYSDGIDKDGSTLTILVNPNMTAASGRHTCAVMLSNENGRCTTWNFCVDVAYTPALGSEEAKAYFEAFEAGELAADIAAVDDRTAKAVAELNARVSAIIASGTATEGNTELIDIRTGADGKVYQTAGDAVRGQVGELKGDIVNHANAIPFNIGYELKHGYYDENLEFTELGSYSVKVTEKIPCVPNEVYMYIGRHAYEMHSAYFFSSNGDLITTIDVDYSDEPTEITVPNNNNITTVMFMSFRSNLQYTEFFVARKNSYENYFGLENVKEDVSLCSTNFPFTAKVNSLSNAYIDMNGDIVESTNVFTKYTDLLRCESGEKYLYNGVGIQFSASILYFDASKNFISAIQINSPYTYTETTIPSNVYYVKFASISYTSIGSVILDAKKKNAEYLGGNLSQVSTSLLSYKKYVSCGDSFTHGDFTGLADIYADDIYDKETSQYKTYPWQIANRNNMFFSNLAVNGDTITDFVKESRYSNIPIDTDYCTICYGLNDYSRGIEIGTITDTSTSTFYGCWNTFFAWMRENRPYLHLGVIVMSAYLDDDYRDAIINSAKKFGYPYLDMKNDDKVPAFMGYYNHWSAKNGMDLDVSNTLTLERYVSETNEHPNIDAHKFMSTFVEDFIRSL